MQLVDNHGRVVNYLRLAVTDRCNLRCFYCMPAEGIQYVPRPDLLTFEEMVRIVSILEKLGIKKLRLTGGEPFLRTDLMQFLEMISGLGLAEIHLTTNGTLTKPHISSLKKLGITSVNLSLDTLDRNRFFSITRRDAFDDVWNTFRSLLDHGISVKINMVVMENRNSADIIPMAMLAHDYPVQVRFIEEMPFNGSGAEGVSGIVWNHLKIRETLRESFNELESLPIHPTSTSVSFRIPGFLGNVGIIAAYSRTFCGTCNRLRITPTGMLRTCLYDEGIFNIRDLLRQGATDSQVSDVIFEVVGQRAKDGFEAEKRRWSAVSESMATVGG